MKAYMQRMGRSLMLPVATLPVAALFSGIGYWIDPMLTATTAWAFYSAAWFPTKCLRCLAAAALCLLCACCR